MRTRIIIMSIVMTLWIIVATGILVRDAHAEFTIHDTAGHTRPALTRWTTTASRNTALPNMDVTVATRPAGPITECDDDEASACYIMSEHTIYMHRGDRDFFLHELGHAFDQSMLTDKQRDRFREIRGIPYDTPWWSDTDFIASPGEQFARGYALCATQGPRIAAANYIDADVDYTVTRSQHHQTCRLIAAAARESGALDYTPAS